MLYIFFKITISTTALIGAFTCIDMVICAVILGTGLIITYVNKQ